MYKGSWIAEITIVRPLHKLIGVYQDNDEVLQETKEARREVKKYSPGSQWSHYATAFQNGKLRARGKDAQGALAKLKARAPLFERQVAKMSSIFDEEPPKVETAVTGESAEGEERKTLTKKQYRKQKQQKQKQKEEKAKKNVHNNPMEVCVGAFVTFNNEESAAVCLANYRNSRSSFGRFWQPQGLRFKSSSSGKATPIQVERAREPADIRWENLEYDFVKRHAKTRAIKWSKFLTFLLLLFSFVFLLVMSKLSMIPIIASTVVIITVNNWLEGLMYRCTDTEFHSSHSVYCTSIGMKIFVGCFINTALVTLAIAGKIPNDIFFPPAAFGIFGGDLTEYNREWYSAVGESVVLTMALNAVEPNATPLLEELYATIKQRWKTRGGGDFSSQRQMNMLFAPTEIPMEARYALVLNTVFCCLFFSPGIPILWAIGALSMATIYATDKWMLLRVYKKPYFDPSFAKICCTVLPYAALLHMLNAFWMLGCSELLIGMASPIAGTFIADLLHGMDPFGEEGFASKLDRVHCLPYAFVLGVLVVRSLMPLWLVKVLVSLSNLYETTMNTLVVSILSMPILLAR
jgi:hypothetical protein